MAKELFIIFDRVDLLEVTGTTIIPDGYDISGDHDGVMDMSDDDMKPLFLYVRDRLKTHRIFIPKNYEGNLIKEDLIEEPYDVIEIERQRKLTKGKEVLTSRISLPEIFHSIEFMLLNNFLIERGYIITNENRTEKYLEIIETGDIELIEKLELFLEARDSMLLNYTWYNIYKNYKKQIERAESIDELNNIWKEYLQSFE